MRNFRRFCALESFQEVPGDDIKIDRWMMPKADNAQVFKDYKKICGLKLAVKV